MGYIGLLLGLLVCGLGRIHNCLMVLHYLVARLLKLVRNEIKVLKPTIYWVKGELVDYYGLRYSGGVL